MRSPFAGMTVSLHASKLTVHDHRMLHRYSSLLALTHECNALAWLRCNGFPISPVPTYFHPEKQANELVGSAERLAMSVSDRALAILMQAELYKEQQLLRRAMQCYRSVIELMPSFSILPNNSFKPLRYLTY